MALNGQSSGEKRLNGQTVIRELLRNMELGRFEMEYTILLPCVFNVYLHPDDHGRLSGVFELLAEDSRRALRARVAELNRVPTLFGVKRARKQAREYKIGCRDWVIEFLADTDGVVPPGDVEIHSELSEAAQPGFRGAKTTLMDRDPAVTSARATGPRQDPPARPADKVYAEIRYEDDSGPQVFLITQNQIRIGRGGDREPADIALYTNDEVSREHLVIRRDAGTGRFFATDKSTNGTWLDGRRLERNRELMLAEKAELKVSDTVTLIFQVRR